MTTIIQLSKCSHVAHVLARGPSNPAAPVEKLKYTESRCSNQEKTRWTTNPCFQQHNEDYQDKNPRPLPAHSRASILKNLTQGWIERGLQTSPLEPPSSTEAFEPSALANLDTQSAIPRCGENPVYRSSPTTSQYRAQSRYQSLRVAGL